MLPLSSSITQRRMWTILCSMIDTIFTVFPLKRNEVEKSTTYPFFSPLYLSHSVSLSRRLFIATREKEKQKRKQQNWTSIHYYHAHRGLFSKRPSNLHFTGTQRRYAKDVYGHAVAIWPNTPMTFRWQLRRSNESAFLKRHLNMSQHQHFSTPSIFHYIYIYLSRPTRVSLDANVCIDRHTRGLTEARRSQLEQHREIRVVHSFVPARRASKLPQVRWAHGTFFLDCQPQTNIMSRRDRLEENKIGQILNNKLAWIILYYIKSECG